MTKTKLRDLLIKQAMDEDLDGCFTYRGILKDSPRAFWYFWPCQSKDSCEVSSSLQDAQEVHLFCHTISAIDEKVTANVAITTKAPYKLERYDTIGGECCNHHDTYLEIVPGDSYSSWARFKIVKPDSNLIDAEFTLVVNQSVGKESEQRESKLHIFS